MNDYTFGNFLCSLRTEKGLSQSQLGEMLGVTNKAVSKWENGVAKPNTSLLPKIAEIFDITVEELFASRRIERNDELERIKIMLSKQKNYLKAEAQYRNNLQRIYTFHRMIPFKEKWPRYSWR